MSLSDFRIWLGKIIPFYEYLSSVQGIFYNGLRILWHND
jgi:hypothetical protein